MSELENAIACYQASTGLPVTIHDLTHKLWRDLPLQQFRHSSPYCEAVKKGPEGEKCMRFEISEFRAEAHRWKDGRVHQCHAGYVELAMPVFEGEDLLFVLFSGPASVEDETQLDYRAPRTRLIRSTPEARRLPVVKPTQFPFLKENLKQLGARLRCWIHDMAAYMPSKGLSRSILIRKYIEDHYSEPVRLSDIAEILNLSPDRTRHLIKAECGMNFSELLLKTRLKAANALLLNSDFPINVVAQMCGFSDSSTFNRYFKDSFERTPRQWRMSKSG